jgi:hypothetical protein
MEQERSRTPAEGALVVSLDDVVRRRLVPGDPELTFGRSRSSDTHLHVGPPAGGADCNVSRRAGSVRWDGRWTLRNESDTRPFVVVVRGHRIPMPPATVDRRRDWPIGPDGVVVELSTPTHTYEIGLRPLGPPDPDDPGGPALPDGSGPSTTPALRPPTPHERRLLGAKFLSRRQPGRAIGDELAAERARRAHPEEEGNATASAVMNVVGRWRAKLQDIGLPDITGRANVDRVGEYLLAYGVVTEDDRPALPPVHDDDPRA